MREREKRVNRHDKMEEERKKEWLGLQDFESGISTLLRIPA